MSSRHSGSVEMDDLAMDNVPIGGLGDNLGNNREDQMDDERDEEDGNECQDNVYRGRPTWGYASGKTMTQGVLNGSLLTSTSLSLWKFCAIPEDERDGSWLAIIIIQSILIAFQILATILALWRAPITPKSKDQERKAKRMHRLISILIYFIGVFHFIISFVGNCKINYNFH